MSRPRAWTVIVSMTAIALLAARGTWAQEALTAKPDAAGTIHLSRGGVELAMIELNAHGPSWQYAPQASATAQVSDLPGQAGKQFVGTLPIPNTDGGAIKYTESVTALPQGLRIEYDLSMTQTMNLNGLQVSICLPVAQYGGKEVLISEPGANPRVAGLPEEQGSQVWSGQGAKIEVAAGTDDAVTIELRAATDVMIQDLRQWERPVFEFRFPAIMEDPPREVTAEDRFHLDLTVTFAAPVRLEAP